MIWMFPNQNPFVQEHAWKKLSLSLQVVAHMCIWCDSHARSYVIPLHAAYEHLMHFLCTYPMHVP